MKETLRKCILPAIALLIAILLLMYKSDAQGSQTFSTAGTFTFTAPAGVTSVTVQCWGGGGKGGSTTTLGHTGGGGGGAYSKKNTIAVTPGNLYTVVVGAGATTTSNGGDSYFIDISTVLAKGGISVANNSTNGVAGGSAASGVGDTKFSGGSGANGVTGQGGGGGSSAGTAANGGNGSGGTGGTAPAGGGSGGNGASTGGTPQAGGPPGGGGGGTSSLGSSSGGNGADGKVIVSWTCTPPAAPTVTSPINYCLNATASQLTATGSNLLWYTVPSGGTGSSTAPTPSTSTAGTTSYYVSQTVGCEGPRAQINVIVNAQPVASVANQSDITCFAANDGTITVKAAQGTQPDSYSFSVDNGTNWQAPTIGTDQSKFSNLLPNHAYRIKVRDDRTGCVSK